MFLKNPKLDRLPVMDAQLLLEKVSGTVTSGGVSLQKRLDVFNLLFLEIWRKIAQTQAEGLFFWYILLSRHQKDMFQVFPSKCSEGHY